MKLFKRLFLPVLNRKVLFNTVAVIKEKKKQSLT